MLDPMKTELVTGEMPLLGPGANVLENLMQYPIPILRQAAEKRGLQVRAKASRAELANRLLRETVRRQAEDMYSQQDQSFLSVDTSYPFLTKLLRDARPKEIFDIGCGTGLVATRCRNILPADGSYYGVDQVAAGVDRANDRLRGDNRFHFAVEDAEGARVRRGSDLVMFCWVMNWLDTHSVNRIFRRLGKLSPDVTLITCVAFLACVKSRNGRPLGGSHQFSVARDYLRGKDHGEAEALWDLTRYRCYYTSLVQNFRIVEEHVRPGGNIFWVARSRGRT